MIIWHRRMLRRSVMPTLFALFRAPSKPYQNHSRFFVAPKGPCRPTITPAQPGQALLRSDQHCLFHPRGGGAAAWVETEALASFRPIGDVAAPGTPSTHQPHLHPAPVDDRRGVGRTYLSLYLRSKTIVCRRCIEYL